MNNVLLLLLSSLDGLEHSVFSRIAAPALINLKHAIHPAPIQTGAYSRPKKH
jgi:hypothetical protein